MATVIDELFVLLKLDASQFSKAQKQAAESFLKTKQEAARTGKQMEESGKQAAQFFTKLRNETIGFLGALVGAKSVKDFVVYMTNLNAETGRTAQVFGTSAKTIATWRGVFESVGGNAQSANSTIRNLTMEYQRFALTGESSFLPYLRALGVYLQDEKTGKMKDFTQFMLELSVAVERLSKTDPAKVTAILSGMGLDEAAIFLTQMGPEKLRALIKEQEKLATVTKADTDAALELMNAWNRLSQSATGVGRAILTNITPLLSRGLNFFTNLIEWHKNADPEQYYSGMTKKSASGGGGFSNDSEMRDYIIAAAKKRGIDPAVALKVWESEGKNGVGPSKQSTVIRSDGTREQSFGPYQLYMGGGLGNKFQSSTGLDPRDPNTFRQQIDFSLDEAVKGGWGPWHGWKGAPRAGLPSYPTMAGGAGGNVSSSVSIGSMTINTQATDAQGIAQSIKPAIEQANLGISANAGPQ